MNKIKTINEELSFLTYKNEIKKCLKISCKKTTIFVNSLLTCTLMRFPFLNNK